MFLKISKSEWLNQLLVIIIFIQVLVIEFMDKKLSELYRCLTELKIRTLEKSNLNNVTDTFSVHMGYS